MAMDFSDLEQLAQSIIDADTIDTDVIDSDTISALAKHASEYTFASLDEILDLLAMVVEPYNAIKATLPLDLRQSAQKEMQFFRELLQQRLDKLIAETGFYSPNIVLAT